MPSMPSGTFSFILCDQNAQYAKWYFLVLTVIFCVQCHYSQWYFFVCTLFSTSKWPVFAVVRSCFSIIFCVQCAVCPVILSCMYFPFYVQCPQWYFYFNFIFCVKINHVHFLSLHIFSAPRSLWFSLPIFWAN